MSTSDATASRIPTFDEMLSDSSEQFDVRSELLASVLTYLSSLCPAGDCGHPALASQRGPEPDVAVRTIIGPLATTGGIAVA